MLPSLRPLIAESMRLNANASMLEYPAWMAVLRGAATLEWCDANDPDNEAIPVGRCEELEDAMADIQAALDDWIMERMAKPAAFRDRLSKLLAG